MKQLIDKDFVLFSTYEDSNLYLLRKDSIKEGVFTKYHHLFNNLSYDECFKNRNLYDGDMTKIIDFDKIKSKASNYKELTNFTPIEDYLNLLKSGKYTLIVTYYPYGMLSLSTISDEINSLEVALDKGLIMSKEEKPIKIKYVELTLNEDGEEELYQLELNKLYSDSIDSLELKDKEILCNVNGENLIFKLDEMINTYICEYEE